MPTTYRPRPSPCTHCGDTVLVVEISNRRLWGFRIGRGPRFGLEHPDEGPDGEPVDEVDDACHRRRVTR